MKDEILQLYQKKNQSFSLEDLIRLLDITKQEDFQRFHEVIYELEANYELVLTKKKRYIKGIDAGYFQGVISINQKGFGFVDFPDQQSLYISPKHLLDAMDKDTVVVKQIPGNHEGEIVKVVQRHLKYVVGTVLMKRKPFKFVPDDARINQRIEISNYQDFNLVHQHKILVKIDAFGRNLHGHIEKILGHVNDPGIDIVTVLANHQIDTEFPTEVLEQVNHIPQEVLEKDAKHRLDLRDQLIITIDGADAKDLDDAISVEKIKNGFRLGVHIADVSHYVTEDSPLDKEAWSRGNSTYLVDRVVPMLPQALSNGVCSLNEAVNRLTLSCIMDVNFKGDVTNYRIVPTIIKTRNRMTYTAVNRIISGHEKTVKQYPHLVEFLTDALRLSKIIRQKKRREGAIDFETKESVFVMNSDGTVKDIKARQRLEAERMIEDFMVLANECVAHHMVVNQYPGIYRIHTKPDGDKIRSFLNIASLFGYRLKEDPENIQPKSLQKMLKAFTGKDEYDVLSGLMLRSMQKARYDQHCYGHFGLALKEYTHFTSPIRRYPDLVLHRMIKRYALTEQKISRKQEASDREKLQDAAVHSSITERRSIDAEREVEALKKAEYMEQFINEVFKGIIISVTSFGFFVQLSNTVEGLVHLERLTDDRYQVSDNMLTIVGMRHRKEYRIGQKVKVKVINVNKERRQIDFSLV